MQNLRNRVQLIGRLGATPEVITTESGKMLAKMNLATNEKHKNAKGEWVEQTLWHQVVAWGKQAEIAKNHLQKGKEICVEGKLSNRSYQDKTGATRYITEVVCSDILMLGSKSA